MKSLWLCLFLIAVPELSFGSESWQEVSRADDILVYQKKTDETPTISLRGEGLIKAKVETVFALMKDSAQATQWIPYVSQKKVLKVLDDKEQISYTHIAMPWPLTDRYTLTRETAERRADGSIYIEMSSIEVPEFEAPAAIRAQLYSSHFRLVPQNRGEETLLLLEINTDPKGMIPKWLVNLTQKSWPRDYIQGLRRQLAK